MGDRSEGNSVSSGSTLICAVTPAQSHGQDPLILMAGAINFSALCTMRCSDSDLTMPQGLCARRRKSRRLFMERPLFYKPKLATLSYQRSSVIGFIDSKITEPVMVSVNTDPMPVALSGIFQCVGRKR
jgi:hypothetical protein